MTQDGRTAVLLVQKLVHEHMYRRTERVQGEIPDIFGEGEQRERRAEREVREGGLLAVWWVN